MNRKYIIIIPDITGMGGAQMYVRNKLIYMQKEGWSVDLISAYSGKIYIQELSMYNLFIPELVFNYYLFPQNSRTQIINKIVDRIQDKVYDEIIIETTCIPTSTWGEIIAEKCHARHFCYLLQEDNTIISKKLQNFFTFKLKRHELASITNNSIYDMFFSFAPISLEQSVACCLPAYCNNVIDDIDSDWLKIINNYSCDYKIGLLSRLNKPFVIPLLKDFINYANKYKNKQFLLVLIGGSIDSKVIENKIYKLFRHSPNVHLVITGLLFPIPIKLFDLFDVFLASAGSAWVCMRSGIPTISVDGKDFKPIGILGRTTDNCLFRGINEPSLNLDDLMDDILHKGKYKKNRPSFDDIKLDFSLHDQFMSNMTKEKKYYFEGNLKKNWSEILMSMNLSLLGANNYLILNKFKSNIINSF